MQTVHIEGGTGDSQVLIGEKLANANKYTSAKDPIIITDRHVWDLHGGRFPAGRVITIDGGEKMKNLATVEMIYRQLID